MQTIIFECETVTPMFMAGADGVTPELRAPSIKGALRFWWRAMNGHLPEEKLREYEGAIFGNTSHRSCFSIHVNASARTFVIATPPVPHRGYKVDAINPGTRFQVTLQIMPLKRDGIDFGASHLQSLFELTVVLGGIGKRVRRGMGSYKIIAINGDAAPLINGLDFVHELIKKHTSHYTFQNGTIFLSYNGNMQRYPWIQKIEIGKPQQQITSVISNATHEVKKQYGSDYEPNLGHASNGRFASPVFVSVLGDGRTPIITSLNTIPDRGRIDPGNEIQKTFSTHILNSQ
jgi:CRISPR-associated protein Cmr1